MESPIFDVIVVGGGPAGMLSAGRAGELGAKVLLIEKNERLGKKLSITGGRRCNITNAEFDNHLFLDNFPETKGFLFSPFSQFNVQSTFDFFTDRGLPLIVEDRKRAFPKSEKAEDVCRVLDEYIRESGNVKVALNEGVLNAIIKDGKVIGVRTSFGDRYGKTIIFATGGYAAPETGSNGEGIRMLAKLGHKVAEPNPNLSPLRTDVDWVHRLSGVTVEEMTIRFKQNDKTIFKETGRLLFTHFGISGPLIINSSHRVKELLKTGPVTAVVDLFPNINEGELDSFLLDLFKTQNKKQLKNVLADLLPNKLAEQIWQFPGMDFGGVPVNSVSRDDRKKLGTLLKNLSFGIHGIMGLAWSIAADGGVDPKEVNFKTMQSKIRPNVYLVGDTIDINRPSGGFSLQLCWTTGWIAGTHAATESMS